MSRLKWVAEFTQDGKGMLQLVKSLNEIADSKLPSDKIEIIFNHYWPILRDQIFQEERVYSSSNITFQEIDLTKYLERLEYDNITSIDIIGHTGENLIKKFLNTFENNLKIKNLLMVKRG